ncbi:MAG: phosphotransferase [Proteobacteria bacterium]|nr:phosphotransferase [Pseudomonadota bacterium]
MHAEHPSSGVTRLSSLPIWSEAPVIEPVPGGRTNENFRVSAGGRSYFARIGNDLPHHHVRRTNEARCHRLAAAAGVAPSVIHTGDGILVTAFIEGRTLMHTEPVDDRTLGLIARALNKIHRYPAPPDLNPFDPVIICRKNLADLPANFLPQQRRRLLEAILKATPALHARCMIHADLIPENFIVADERIYIVDWEYAGYGDPAVDLAQIIVLFRLDHRQTELLLRHHGGVDIATARALGPAVAARETLWCEIQSHFVGIRGDLEEYRALCWRRLEGAAP